MDRSWPFIFAISLGLFVSVLSYAGKSGAGEQLESRTPARNLILITADTLRADHLQTYGYFRDTAPRIDALARESLVFDACFAPIARTTPSHLSLMTGVYPLEHGVSTNFGHLSRKDKREQAFVSSESLSTFAEAVSEELHTAGFVSAAPLKRITGLANGFETWSEPQGNRRPGSETNALLFAWLKGESEPFFLWVHYMDAHGPYGRDYPPKKYRNLYKTDGAMRHYLKEREFPALIDGTLIGVNKTAVLTNYYDGSIRVLDEAVGDLIDHLKANDQWEKSVVVFTSDHGQGLGQHGYPGHGEVWSEQLRVPLFIRAPGLAPRHVDRMMSSIDVLPTALALGHMTLADDFMNQARGGDVLANDIKGKPVFGMGGREEGSFSLAFGDWKYIYRPDGQDSLYSLSSDPHELHDLRKLNPKVSEEMRERLIAEISSQKKANEIYSTGMDNQTLDPEHLEQLRALGYTGEE